MPIAHKKSEVKSQCSPRKSGGAQRQMAVGEAVPSVKTMMA